MSEEIDREELRELAKQRYCHDLLNSPIYKKQNVLGQLERIVDDLTSSPKIKEKLRIIRFLDSEIGKRLIASGTHPQIILKKAIEEG